MYAQFPQQPARHDHSAASLTLVDAQANDRARWHEATHSADAKTHYTEAHGCG